MNKTPTPHQIKKEIAGLKAIKPKIRQFSFFGDDNHASIDAQINVLEDNMDDDQIDDLYDPEENYNLNESARHAREWLDGKFEGDGLVKDWEPLIK
jgi:hypothetical protein